MSETRHRVCLLLPATQYWGYGDAGNSIFLLELLYEDTYNGLDCAKSKGRTRLPGGKIDDEDWSEADGLIVGAVMNAARRELWEEFGISGDHLFKGGAYLGAHNGNGCVHHVVWLPEHGLLPGDYIEQAHPHNQIVLMAGTPGGPTYQGPPWDTIRQRLRHHHKC